MTEEVVRAMEDIFEVTKQVYNVPDTPLLKEGMDTVAYSLDVINEQYVNTIKYFCDILENIKSLEIEKATDKRDSTEVSREIIRMINDVLGNNE